MSSEVHITKPAAAQRQIDAAIRIYFSGEDQLAVHTIVAAAHGILVNLDEKRGKPIMNDVYAEALEKVIDKLQLKKISNAEIAQNVPSFKAFIQGMRRKPGNFLKHADRDPHKSLDASTLGTEHLLLEACTLYKELGLKTTREMYTYARWHLAVYPHLESDKMKTDIGYLHELPHDTQLQVGKFLLERLAERSIADQL